MPSSRRGLGVADHGEVHEVELGLLPEALALGALDRRQAPLADRLGPLAEAGDHGVGVEGLVHRGWSVLVTATCIVPGDGDRTVDRRRSYTRRSDRGRLSGTVGSAVRRPGGRPTGPCRGPGRNARRRASGGPYGRAARSCREEGTPSALRRGAEPEAIGRHRRPAVPGVRRRARGRARLVVPGRGGPVRPDPRVGAAPARRTTTSPTRSTTDGWTGARPDSAPHRGGPRAAARPGGGAALAPSARRSRRSVQVGGQAAVDLLAHHLGRARAPSPRRPVGSRRRPRGTRCTTSGTPRRRRPSAAVPLADGRGDVPVVGDLVLAAQRELPAHVGLELERVAGPARGPPGGGRSRARSGSRAGSGRCRRRRPAG